MNIHARGTDPHEPLEAVLRAATVPGHPEELVGEQAAVAAFRTAVVHAPRKRSFLARVLTVKALVVGSVAVSTGVVLAAVGGGLPVPGLEQGNTPPSVTTPAPTTTEQLRDGPTSTTDEPAGRSTSPPPSTRERCGDCRSGDDADRDRPGDDGRSGPDKKRDDEHEGEQPGPMTNDSTANDPPSPSSGRTQTPDSPAQGAETAVPPNGAEPPSPGG
jgi:hypothetical protein